MLDVFIDWAKQPFSQDMGAINWILFIALMLCAITLWKIVLVHIEGSF